MSQIRSRSGGGSRATDHKRNARIAQLSKNGLDSTKIGKMYGITRERVRQLLSRMNLKSPKANYSEQEIANIKELLKVKGFKEVSYSTGINASTLRHLKRRHFPDVNVPRSPRAIWRKRSDAFLIDLYLECKGSYHLMAVKLGVDDSTVSMTMHRRNLHIKYKATRVRAEKA